MTGQIQPYSSRDIAPYVQDFSDAITNYLNRLGLPQDTLLVEIGERRQILNIMPSIVDPWTVEHVTRCTFPSSSQICFRTVRCSFELPLE